MGHNKHTLFTAKYGAVIEQLNVVYVQEQAGFNNIEIKKLTAVVCCQSNQVKPHRESPGFGGTS